MADIKLGVKFKNTHYGKENAEISQIVAVDISKDFAVLEVSKMIDNEMWTTKREFKFSEVKKDFEKRTYEYI